jgi:BA14K-like protein
MRKAIGATLASIVLATGAIGATSVSAAPGRYDQQDHFIQSYCSTHHWSGDCNDWRQHHGRWDESHYHDWYHHHEHDFGPGDAAAAIFGFAAGAITGAMAGAAHGAVNTSHAAACSAHYRTYNPNTDMYMGNDGHRHACRL